MTTKQLLEIANGMIGSRDYAVISADLATLFSGVDGCATVIVIESGNDAYNRCHERLPALANGLYRLWTAEVFTKLGNQAKAHIARIEGAYIARKDTRQGIIDYMTRNGIKRELASMAVGMMTDSQVNAFMADKGLDRLNNTKL